MVPREFNFSFSEIPGTKRFFFCVGLICKSFSISLFSHCTFLCISGVSASVCYREYIADKGKCSKEVTSPLNGTKFDGYQECCRLPDAKGWVPNRKNSLCIPCVKIGRYLVIWLLVLKQKRMWFKPIKSRLFCWTGGQEQ